MEDGKPQLVQFANQFCKAVKEKKISCEKLDCDIIEQNLQGNCYHIQQTNNQIKQSSKSNKSNKSN
jgi:undecaprenyl pyrophosphate synthase